MNLLIIYKNLYENIKYLLNFTKIIYYKLYIKFYIFYKKYFIFKKLKK